MTVNGLGYLLNVGGLRGRQRARFDYVAAQIFAFVFVALNNYFLNRNWTFISEKDSKDHEVII